MLKEFNFIREDPSRYADKLKTFSSFIKHDPKTNKAIFCIPRTIKINLSNGKEAFNKCIENLKTYSPLPLLELKSDLEFPFPFDTPELCSNKDYLTSKFIEMNIKLKGRYSLLGFHYDINVNNPEISTLMQIVDDNNSNGQRRKQILSRDVRYMGISSGTLRDNIICVYVVFAV
jgi:hypothetical protein